MSALQDFFRSLTWRRVLLIQGLWLGSLIGAFTLGVLAMVRPWALPDNMSLRSLSVSVDAPRLAALLLLLFWPLVAGAIAQRARR